MAVQNTVTVSEGILQGQLVHNDFGENFYSFKGIPYAAPPIGDLRFKPPQPAKKWEGIRNATENGPVNYQFDFTVGALSGSEDCLYANVYTPTLMINALLPVMVLIHGGAYRAGSGNDNVYGPEFLVRQGVVFVTFNFRLGVFGFLSLGTADIPGNAGMKDQVAALKWIKKNIRNFGGDPDNITIFGQSSGAASVSLHLLSPMSKGLFKRAIMQSGSAFNYWALAFEPREKAKALARQLGLVTDDDKKLYEFFKVQPKEKLINVNLPVTYIEREEQFNADLGPVIEEDFGQERFLVDDIYNLLQKGIHPDVEVLMGYNQDEFVFLIPSNEVLDKYVGRFNNFSESLVPINLNRVIPIKRQLKVGRKMKEFYFGDKLVTRDDWKQIGRYLDLDFISFGVVQFQKLLALTSNDNYFYKFTPVSGRNLFKAFSTADFAKSAPLVSHSDDLAYLFPIKFLNPKIEKNSTEFRLIDRVTKLWTNFAKSGNPTPDNSLGAEWKPYNLQDQYYMEIGNELTLKTMPDDDDMQFWEQIYWEARLPIPN